MGGAGWEDARGAGQARPVPRSRPKPLCRDEIAATNRASISMARVALGAFPGCGNGKAGQGSRGTGMEGGMCPSTGTSLATPNSSGTLDTFSDLPVGSGFCRGGTGCSPGMCSEQSPVARGGRRGPAGGSGTWAVAGDTTQRSQSLTSAHPSAGRIQMSALLINTSDFNLRSHGIALSSPRSRLQRQFCLQPAQPPPCPRHPGPAASPRCFRGLFVLERGVIPRGSEHSRPQKGCVWLAGPGERLGFGGQQPARGRQRIHLGIGYLPSYLRSQRQRHS